MSHRIAGGPGIATSPERQRRADVMPLSLRDIESIQSASISPLKGIADALNARSIPAPRSGSKRSLCPYVDLNDMLVM
jgi:hypothetical protein